MPIAGRNSITAQARTLKRGKTISFVPLQGSKEKKFAVIVKVSKDKSEKFYKLIPVEMESKEMAVKIDLSDGEGYFSSQGYSWQSAEKQQCNICLKAYTKNK